MLETNVRAHDRTDSNGSPPQTALPERPMTLRREGSYQNQDSGTATPVDEISDPMALSLIHHDELPPVSAPGFEVHRHDFYPGALSHLTPGLGLSPSLTESLWPFNTEDQTHQDFVNYELSESFRNPNFEDEPHTPDMDKDPIDYISGSSGAMGGLSLTSTAGLLTPTESSFEDPSEENARGLLGYIYPQPFLAEDSADMLTYRFDKLTCGILSIMDGPGDNPWRTIMWPMATQSPALYHAINAMSAYHSAWDIPQFRVLGHEHKNASIRFIQEGIRDNSFSVHTAIATALCLGLAEAWDRHSNTGNTHIKGAQVLVRQALKEHQQRRLEGIDIARLKFLCNAWVYMDVMARITTFENDESHDFDNTFLFSGDPDEFPQLITGDTHPGFGIDFGIPVDSRLDPLMGCASTLFPLIGRTANLVRKLVKSDTNSPAIITIANDIKMGLERWDPPNEIDDPEDPDTSVQHTLQTAEAYRWATLLYLHQAVPELPSLSSTELAQRVLQYIATVPLTSRTIIVQTYPLMIAGCEAKTSEDRQWVLNRWEAMIGLMRLGMTQKAQLVMEEVWRRRDAWQANPGANRRLVPTSIVQPQRPRSRPFARSPSGDVRYGEIGDPGRTGMVFSYVDVDDNDSVPGNRPKSPKDEKRERRAMERRDGRDPRMELQDPAYTVRGHLHWIGVMWDWGWESTYLCRAAAASPNHHMQRHKVTARALC